MKAYHVTPRRNVEPILREGLRKDAAGWDAGFVWLLLDQEAAKEMAGHQWALYGS